MARVRHLNNAPILEAMFDFRVRLPSAFDAKIFRTLKKTLSAKYPTVEEGQRASASIEIKDGKPDFRQAEPGVMGYRFVSKDKSEVAQFRLDGFAFSRLHPYTEWDSVLAEAKRLWELYKEKCSPLVLERVGVRYINRLDVPLGIDFDEYLTAGPRLPQELPQSTGHFFMRIAVAENDCLAVIVQTMIEGADKDHLGIIIDVEVSKSSAGGIDLGTVWTALADMREFKNRIFFSLITEKSARLYE